MFELCEGSSRQSVFDRRAEDREEGAERESGEEAIEGFFEGDGGMRRQ